jgi:hypothetical protein
MDFGGAHSGKTELKLSRSFVLMTAGMVIGSVAGYLLFPGFLGAAAGYFVGFGCTAAIAGYVGKGRGE